MHSSQDAADAGIRARIKEYAAAYNRGDAAAVAGIYVEDGTHTRARAWIHAPGPG